MIKIERFYDGATGTCVRNGKVIPLYQGMLINIKEANSVEVTGRVMYTVDELEIAYFTPKQVEQYRKPEEPTVPEKQEEPVQEPVQEAKPAIVFPDEVKNLG